MRTSCLKHWINPALQGMLNARVFSDTACLPLYCLKDTFVGLLEEGNKNTSSGEDFWGAATAYSRAGNILFTLTEKKILRLAIIWYILKVENILSSGEGGKTPFSPVEINQSILQCVNQTSFQSRVLFLASGIHEKNCRNLCFMKDQSSCQSPVGQKTLLHVQSLLFKGEST